MKFIILLQLFILGLFSEVVLTSTLIARNRDKRQEQEDKCPAKSIPHWYHCMIKNQIASLDNECDPYAQCTIWPDVAGDAYFVQCQTSSPFCNFGTYPIPTLQFTCSQDTIIETSNDKCTFSCNNCFTNPDYASNPSTIICTGC
ncbi:10408_t:CDS:1 [Cetraspora pellucida]|uniref:10408_t:CDS:1 n=1 Tax=Cetraspora pellucida TaxID=1433469 RepID=A0A9N9E8W1_9GLOM|nr:10408_t:CDS:1 [Cetraspora pellucida]